jgi:hypothetical protein
MVLNQIRMARQISAIRAGMMESATSVFRSPWMLDSTTAFCSGVSAASAADDDAEAEAREAGAVDVAELVPGEAELGAPVVQDAAPDGEPDARGEDGGETGPEQTIPAYHTIPCLPNRSRADHRGCTGLPESK